MKCLQVQSSAVHGRATAICITMMGCPRGGSSDRCRSFAARTARSGDVQRHPILIRLSRALTRRAAPRYCLALEAARQGDALNPVDKMLRTAGGDAVAVLAEHGSDDGDVARARADEGVPDQQAAAHLPLGIGEPTGGAAVGAEQGRLGQGARTPPVGLDLARPARIHRREVRVRDGDLVAERLQATGDRCRSCMYGRRKEFRSCRGFG